MSPKSQLNIHNFTSYGLLKKDSRSHGNPVLSCVILTITGLNMAAAYEDDAGLNTVFRLAIKPVEYFVKDSVFSKFFSPIIGVVYGGNFC